MKCMKCTGTVWLDLERLTARHYDLSCINCGWRTIVDTSTNPFGKWLREQVLSRDGSNLFWVERTHIGKRTLLERKGKRWRIVCEQDISDGRQAVEA